MLHSVTVGDIIDRFDNFHELRSEEAKLLHQDQQEMNRLDSENACNDLERVFKKF